MTHDPLLIFVILAYIAYRTVKAIFRPKEGIHQEDRIEQSLTRWFRIPSVNLCSQKRGCERTIAGETHFCSGTCADKFQKGVMRSSLRPLRYASFAHPGPRRHLPLQRCNGVWHFTNIKSDKKYKFYLREPPPSKGVQYIKDYEHIIIQASRRFRVSPR
jgi:hypothetical protein